MKTFGEVSPAGEASGRRLEWLEGGAIVEATDSSRTPRGLPARPDHDALERQILEWWEENRVFPRLRDGNRGGPSYSFIDGPVTANKALGVHTAWGRTLKDVFQRFKAMTGHELRFQNGYDCQGLWIEVGVEQELGLNSKRQIEEYGLERFAKRCREKVAWSVGELSRGSRRLGYWMDWGNDYLTFSDNNIEYIWRFLKISADKGWLYKGRRAAEWCPRCGTSISQHEISMSGVYQERSDLSAYVRFPLLDREGESLVIWTTTPWTLPANVAAAVHPDYQYGRRTSGEWVATENYTNEDFEEALRGSQLEGWRYQGPFDDLVPGAGVEHRVILWDEVILGQGTGIVHVAPGAGEEDFLLSTELALPVLMPVDESGRFYGEYGWLAGMSTAEAAGPIIEDLEKKGYLVRADEYVHSYPHCWRCDTPLIFRIADDWYIDVADIRPELLEASATVDWTPSYLGKLMDDWLRNMGDWNISRRRFYGLPLPFYPCECGHVNVIGSRAELIERATSGVDQLEELHRPWVDRVLISCERCDQIDIARVAEVGDVWLDAGIVPFSTLGWKSDEWVPGGNANGAAAGLTNADLPDHEYWEKWFPADLVSEMREQVRLWFYAQLFMSVALVGRAPFRKVLGYERMLGEDGREMHGSWGNLISAEEAFERMGADVMRWLYCAHPPDRNLRFGYASANDVQRKLLTLWNSAKFLVDYSNIEGFKPSYDDLKAGPRQVDLKDIDRWLLARADLAIIEATRALEEYRVDVLIEDFEAYLDDLSNWYIRRNRRRFYSYEEAAFRTLWVGLVTALRLIGPVVPFLAEHLWQVVVGAHCSGAPDSVHLAGWPTPLGKQDPRLLEEMAVTRRIVEAGRRARREAGVKLRQPLRKAVVRGGALARGHAESIKDELRVKQIVFDDDSPVDVIIRPDFSILGPRLGSKVKEVADALEEGRYEESDGVVIAAGVRLTPEEVLRTERPRLEGWAMAQVGNVGVAVDLSLDDELIVEGRLLELIRSINVLRKQEELNLTDRIVLILPSEQSDLVDAYGKRIADEVLATSIVVDRSSRQARIVRADQGSEHSAGG
jgi:isoleucyl-tRNA synthetase